VSDRLCWIANVPVRVAEGRPRDSYTRVGRPDGSVHNLHKAYASRPAGMAQAYGLYRAIMHGDENSLPPWLLELVSSQVGILAGWDYASAHHGANFNYWVRTINGLGIRIDTEKVGLF
jgi:hypothetical protein